MGRQVQNSIWESLNKLEKFIITVFLGAFGVHKFLNKKYTMGIVYLFTAGLFMLGWIYDIMSLLIPERKEGPTQTSITKNQQSSITANTYTINSSIPNDFFESSIYNEIRIVQESTYLIDTSTNIDTVIGRIQFIPEHINYLMTLEKKGLYNAEPTAHEYYKKYVLLKDTVIQEAIVRCYKNVLDKASELKTEKGRTNRINKYFQKLESLKPMLSPIMSTYVDNFIKIRTNC